MPSPHVNGIARGAMPLEALPESLRAHRVRTPAHVDAAVRGVTEGRVVWEPVRSLWFSSRSLAARSCWVRRATLSSSRVLARSNSS